MPLDGKAVARGCGAAEAATVHTQLCRAQLDAFRRAAREGGPLVVGCTQEAPLFTETLEEMGLDVPVTFTNIRERAGWSDEARATTPKIAALLAEAAVDVADVPTVSLKSAGSCLVYGRDETAIDVARQLARRLDVTVVLTRADAVIPPRVMDVPVVKGTIVAARGHLGAFEIVVDGYAPTLASSRAALAFEAPRNGVASRCDLILDLTGGTPLFPAGARLDGYLRPDPGNPAAVQKALFEASDLVGEFDKPRYVDFTASLCAHSRSRKTGCTRCLDVCPTGAITSAGDTVAIDPHVCAGCGSCAGVCPTGAASYTMPPESRLLERLRTLLTTFAQAGGRDGVLLVHDGRHGDELIAMMARFGCGLPARVLPFAVNETSQIGVEFLSCALAYGARRVLLLVDPAKAHETTGLAHQVEVANTIADGLGYGADRVRMVVEADPDAVETLLHALPALPGPASAEFLPLGTRRTNTRLAVQHLHAQAPAPVDVVALPAGAAFGAVEVDVAGCTLCLSCTSACPTGALGDNPDKPMLTFQEDACIQCGLCRSTCPERVIELAPRMNFRPEARSHVVVKEEEPFECVRCSKPFGSRSSIERIVEKLAGRHSMFQSADAIERIKMCEDCRVIVQFDNAGAPAPMAAGARPLPRTTADYLREREQSKVEES